MIYRFDVAGEMLEELLGPSQVSQMLMEVEVDEDDDRIELTRTNLEELVGLIGLMKEDFEGQLRAKDVKISQLKWDLSGRPAGTEL